MAWPEYAVPLTLHDLPAKETYKHIINSLKALEDASNGVFTRIEKAAQSRRGDRVAYGMCYAKRKPAGFMPAIMCLPYRTGDAVQTALTSFEIRCGA